MHGAGDGSGVATHRACLNPETAPSWRNAASGTEDEIFTYFDAFEAED